MWCAAPPAQFSVNVERSGRSIGTTEPAPVRPRSSARISSPANAPLPAGCATRSEKSCCYFLASARPEDADRKSRFERGLYSCPPHPGRRWSAPPHWIVLLPKLQPHPRLRGLRFPPSAMPRRSSVAGSFPRRAYQHSPESVGPAVAQWLHDAEPTMQLRKLRPNHPRFEQKAKTWSPSRSIPKKMTGQPSSAMHHPAPARGPTSSPGFSLSVPSMKSEFLGLMQYS